MTKVFIIYRALHAENTPFSGVQMFSKETQLLKY